MVIWKWNPKTPVCWAAMQGHSNFLWPFLTVTLSVLVCGQKAQLLSAFWSGWMVLFPLTIYNDEYSCASPWCQAQTLPTWARKSTFWDAGHTELMEVFSLLAWMIQEHPQFSSLNPTMQILLMHSLCRKSNGPAACLWLKEWGSIRRCKGLDPCLWRQHLTQRGWF